MRLIAPLLAPVLALTVAAAASSAFAAPASVSVSVAPELQKKFHKTYGEREATLLTGDLQTSVEKALAKTGAHDGARIELTITDAKPNRPTFKQLGDTPGLSLESRSIGGAAITGKVIAADGRETPVKYSWYETDIREVRAHWTWTDAEFTFDRLARQLAKGAEVASR